MHVLYVIDSLVGGGAEKSLAAIAPYCLDLGIELDVAYLNDRPGVQHELRQAGAQLFAVSDGGTFVDRVDKVLRLARSRRPDLIHTTLFQADLVGRVAGGLSRTPVVSSIVNVHYGQEQFAAPGLRQWKVVAARIADAASAHLVTRFHALSSHVADVMSRRLGISRNRIDVVPRGRSPDLLGDRSFERRTVARASLEIDPETPVVLAAARHEHQKGLDLLLRAFPAVLDAVPDARLLVAGREGNQTMFLRELSAHLGLDGFVRFLGPRGDVAELLCAADVFAFPSRWEGLGSVVIEAMALEAPIVAMDLPPVREVVGGEAGALLVPTHRSDAFAGSIITALTDQHGSAERATASRARFLERFTIDRVADGMKAFYERALRNAAGR